MKRLSLSFLLGIFILTAPSYAADVQRYHSPSGKFDVAFVPKERRLYASAQERDLPSGIKSQVYTISFYPAGQDSAVAVTYFTDIQATPDSLFPTPLLTLVKRILWSPQEDFAVLPTELWPHPGANPAARQAISLRSDSVWQTADFPFQGEPLIWANPLQALGNVTDGCRLEIGEFDGHSGRIVPVQAADPPVGYQLLSSDSEKIVMRKILGNCATDEDRRTFHAECITLNLSFGRREIGPCPP